MKVATNVLAVLGNAQCLGNALVLTGQLDRSLYVAANKVLEAAGGKWNRKVQAHVFEGDAAEAIDQIILTGEITIPQDFDYYPTPPAVVAKLLELANIKPGMSCLEPSAGQGAIAIPMMEAGGYVTCIEMLSGNVKALLYQGFQDILVSDFLALRPVILFDRIVMNPPFSKQADIKHVTHALKFLKPDGVLVAVMSAAVMFRTDRRTAEFCEQVQSRGGSFRALPEGSFKSSGTMVNTCVVKVPA